MTESELLQWLRKMVREEVRAALTDFMEPLQALPEVELITIKELCTALKVSKQTLYNWQKHPKTKMLIEKHRQKVGGKVGYNVVGIKAAIKNNPLHFGSRGEYGILTEDEKINRRYRSLKGLQGLGETLSQTDAQWLQQEDERRQMEQ